jgi:TusA-related sulfurtransferase
MARFDKVEPKGGSFRAKLGFAIPANLVGVPLGVRIDGSGTVQRGSAVAATSADIRGVICPSNVMAIGDAIDVMTDGEIVDLTGLTAGTTVYADSTTAVNKGDLVTSATTNKAVGWTVEPWRLIVRVSR